MTKIWFCKCKTSVFLDAVFFFNQKSNKCNIPETLENNITIQNIFSM